MKLFLFFGNLSRSNYEIMKFEPTEKKKREPFCVLGSVERDQEHVHNLHVQWMQIGFRKDRLQQIARINHAFYLSTHSPVNFSAKTNNLQSMHYQSMLSSLFVQCIESNQILFASVYRFSAWFGNRSNSLIMLLSPVAYASSDSVRIPTGKIFEQMQNCEIDREE